ncbi:hypothetical protein DY000_02015485 [Brassica cretica]|uniref:Aspartic peptidase DDI1-type domain-containing protein n=1 Tax=Brassica cretica TaxID=69181 RepID=A0ABQ7CS57_BRACR|nr:hypothetical protein DY000_02015485 [Brassica cretica]
MFFRETREKEEDIRRMFCEAREKMKRRITLKKKTDPGQFAIPCTVQCIEFPHALCDTRASVNILPRVMADHLGLQVEPLQELFTFADCSQKSSRGIVRHLEVHIGNSLVLVDFHVLDIKLNWNSSLLLGRAFLSTVGAVCNLQTNQLCQTLIDPNAHYDSIPVKKPQTISRRINDPGIIAACHCEDEYETEYSESIETHTATSIDSGNQKLTDIPHDESVDSNPDEWESDYYNPTIDAYTRQYMHTDEYDEDFEEERAIEYRAILDEEDKLLHHSSWKRNAPSFDMASLPSIDTQPQQRCRKRASTDTAYYKSVDTDFNRVREGDYSIATSIDSGNQKLTDIPHDESVDSNPDEWESDYYNPTIDAYTRQYMHTDEYDEDFEEERAIEYRAILDEEDKLLHHSSWKRNAPSFDMASLPSIDTQPQQRCRKRASTNTAYYKSVDTDFNRVREGDYSIDKLQDSFTDKELLNMQKRDDTDQIQAEAAWERTRSIDTRHQQSIDKLPQKSIDINNTTSIDNNPILNTTIDTPSLFTTTISEDFWKELQKISQPTYVFLNMLANSHRQSWYQRSTPRTRSMRCSMARLLERASKDQPAYICLPEHASQFTQTKLVPEIYTKDEINEMFYGVCGEHDRNKEAFQMKLDGV